MLKGLSRFALYYPLRIVGTYFVAFIVWLYSFESGEFTLFRYLLLGTLIVYPHIVRYLVWRYPQDRLKLELRAFVVDSVIIGMVVHMTGFTPLLSFVLITVGLVNALSVAGFRQMFLSACALLSGIAIASVFGGGLEYAPHNIVSIDIAVAVFLFVYFMFFGYSVHIGNALLARSRTELRERQAVLEIEKQRSDALLLDIVPARIAAEMKGGKRIEPAVYDPVTLLAVDFSDFVRTLETHEPRQVLAHLMHCFKAFDAITARRGFEKLKTLGDVYIAVAGLPQPGPRDAAAGVEAALEIRQFLDDLAETRRAHGEFALDARIAVHTGKAIGGTVDTEKMSYDLWGATPKLLMRILKEAPPGKIVISEATRRAAGEDFLSTPAGRVDAGEGAQVPFFNVDRRAA